MSTRGYVGRDVLLEYSTQPPETAADQLVFTRLGMCRGKELNLTWDTVDATGDTSANFLKENLATFKSATVSGDYVSMATDIEGQAAFEDHILIPPVSTGYQPFMWLRLTFGQNGRVVTGNFLVNENNSSAPYSDVVTGTFSGMSNGELTSVRA